MSNLHLYTDEQLLAALRKGDECAFEEIFKRYWSRFYTIARTKIHSHEEAEEIVQAIFFALWEKRETLAIANLVHYLHTAVKNRVINHIRHQITQRKYWEYYRRFIPSQSPVTQDTVDFDNLSEAVTEAVNSLPEKSRQVFRLSRLEGQSTAEIANRLKLSEKAIEYHLTKSLKHLRLYLKDFS
jgi:RNA polymerase sigma-70 factor (ECF subfamily)